MEMLWFCAVAFMLCMYVVLDGFDLGAGILHLSIARNNEERRSVLGAIGPFWDGNEVWLIAAGGTLYFAFPLLYASSFSGFYLPLTIVLWLLILRGLGIEMRHQVDHPMWHSFWDATFSAGSALLAIFMGAALGNVVRGVPLGPDGYFFEPLWTSFTVQPDAGILDWFTVLMGLVGLSTLAVHGGNYIAMKTTGDIQAALVVGSAPPLACRGRLHVHHQARHLDQLFRACLGLYFPAARRDRSVRDVLFQQKTGRREGVPLVVLVHRRYALIDRIRALPLGPPFLDNRDVRADCLQYGCAELRAGNRDSVVDRRDRHRARLFHVHVPLVQGEGQGSGGRILSAGGPVSAGMLSPAVSAWR